MPSFVLLNQNTTLTTQSSSMDDEELRQHIAQE